MKELISYQQKNNDKFDTENLEPTRTADENGFVPNEISNNKELLQGEWERQAGILVSFKFHKVLGISKKEYLSSLPDFSKQEGHYRPLIVDPRINWKLQCKLLKIDFSKDTGDFKDYNDKFKTSDIPYIAWTEYMDSDFFDLSIDETRKLLSNSVEERGGTVYEGLSLVMFRPDLFEGQDLSLPGSVALLFDKNKAKIFKTTGVTLMKHLGPISLNNSYLNDSTTYTYPLICKV